MKTIFVRIFAIVSVALSMQLAAATITFNTNAIGTGFSGSSLMLSNTSGSAATLTFIPDMNIATGVPSNVNLGNFTLVCPVCTTQAVGIGSSFAAFSFNLIVTDLTDGATGTFVGSSTGGTIFSDVSPITINWSPLQLGPGTINAATGSFNSTTFRTTVFTGIVAPNSGAVPGQSTVQGSVTSENPDTVVPEPATLTLVSGVLLVLGLWGRKRNLSV